jgi:hypothetical protein
MGKHLAAVVLAGLLTADTAAGDISIWAIWSPGAKTCPQLLTLEPIAERFLSSPTASHKVEIYGYEEETASQYVEASGYIQGFLTATNIEDWKHGGTGHAVEGVGNAQDAWPWVFSWCRQNPTGEIQQALSQYVETMREKGR